MIVSQMRTLFRERYNLSSNVNDDKENDEVYLYLNSAVNDKIVNVVNTGDWFYIEKELRTLITKTTELTASATSDEIPNGKPYTLPNDFMYFIKAFYELSNQWYSAERINNEESYPFIETPRNKPVIREGKVIYESGTTYTILVDPDDFANLENSKLQYIKEPAVIDDSTNCDLPEHVHEEIVEMAVNLAIEGSENIERFQTHSAIVNPQIRQQ